MPVAHYLLAIQAAKTGDVFGIVRKKHRKVRSIMVSVRAASATAAETIVIKRRPSGGGGDVTLATVDLSTLTADTPVSASISNNLLKAGDQLVAVVTAPAAGAASQICARVEWD